MKSIVFLLLFSLSSAFFQIKPPVFCRDIRRIIQPDIRKNIYADNSNESIIKNISGFYGLVGPDINKNAISTLYELFTGDGVIQGIFFDNGNMTFVKHYIKTEKWVHESNYGKFSKNVFLLPFYIAAYKMNMIPNILGLANTAFLTIRDKTFVLFERDYPYQIHLDFIKNQISTLKKVVINNVNTISGHAKFISDKIYSIDYNILFKNVRLSQFDGDFREMDSKTIGVHYLPVIHDFAVINNAVLFLDAPLQFYLPLPFSFYSIPIRSNLKKPTYLHLYNYTTRLHTEYYSDESFYIFHYGDVSAADGLIEIYCPVYDDLQFTSLNLEGKYRKLTLDLLSKRINIEKNPVLEKMNLDFPIKWGEYVILRLIVNRKIAGFVICRGLEVVRKIDLPANRAFSGEPTLVDISGVSYLMGFSYDKSDNGYLSLVGLEGDSYVEVDLGIEPLIGFHSAFLRPSAQ